MLAKVEFSSSVLERRGLSVEGGWDGADTGCSLGGSRHSVGGRPSTVKQGLALNQVRKWMIEGTKVRVGGEREARSLP